MQQNLPKDFLDRMKELLQEDFPAFLASYEKKNRKSLRLNTLKRSQPETLPFTLEPVAWEKTGYYYREDTPGKHPLHEAGAYYIQEASAMAPVGYLNPQPGEKILDLCAAPGGKSTQIAARMKGQGLLVSNEIHPARAKILSENIERMGIWNAVVTNEDPERLKSRFTGYFDRILVDAPCSGEGMFRRIEEACEEWSPELVRKCAERQDSILDCAAMMLKPGGILVYSTCTFAPLENEGSISRMINRHPEFSIQATEKSEGMDSGHSEWVENPADNLIETIRLWPHKVSGDGHFLAVLTKSSNAVHEENLIEFEDTTKKSIKKKNDKKSNINLGDFIDFQKKYLKIALDDRFILFGEQLYLIPDKSFPLNNIKILRPGLHLGILKSGRFEPSHSLALALNAEQVHNTITYGAEQPEVYNFIEGQTLEVTGEKGWYLVLIDGISIGWGKVANGILKNHYPKGLRKDLRKYVGGKEDVIGLHE